MADQKAPMMCRIGEKMPAYQTAVPTAQSVSATDPKDCMQQYFAKLKSGVPEEIITVPYQSIPVARFPHDAEQIIIKWTPKDVGNAIAILAPAFHSYRDNVIYHGLDGRAFLKLEHVDHFKAIGIDNLHHIDRIIHHRRRLVRDN